MKFTYLGFLQEEAIKMGLDDKDLGILRYFIDFKDSGSMTIRIIDDKPYYWLKYETLLEELPILGITSKRVLGRRLKTLVDADVLEFKLEKKGGTFSFYCVGKNYKKLIASDTKKECTQKYNPMDSKVQPVCTQKYNQNINLLKDPSIKDIYSACNEIIEYLNKKAGTRYKPNSKSTMKSIKARLETGFTVEEFKIVIDNKVRDWLGTAYEMYLRPSTLFSESKFEGYLNQKTFEEDKPKENKPRSLNSFEFDD